MQIGGVGSNYNGHTHHVTSFSHPHAAAEQHPLGKLPGSANAAGASGAETVREEKFSLTEWLADPFRSIRRVVGRIWNGKDQSGVPESGPDGRGIPGGEAAASGMSGELLWEETGSGSSPAGHPADPQTAQAQSLSASGQPHTPQIAAAATSIRQQDIYDNPYFSAVRDTDASSRRIWQRWKVKFHSVTDFLARRFSFSGSHSFQAKKERPREDLRRRSRYRGTDLEVDCVLTDDSYLLDSYDRQGNYSRLSTRTGGGSAAGNKGD